MVQVYFFLTLVNILGGVTLASAYFEEKFALQGMKVFQIPLYRKVLGIVALIIGFLGLLSVLPGDIPIIGNLLPALAALMTGAGLFMESLADTETSPEWSQQFKAFLTNNATLIGFGAIALGFLHFLFPSTILL